MKDLEDWKQVHIHARDFLGHTCSPRCQICVGEGEGKENFRCKKINTVFAGKNPLEHEFVPLQYAFSEEFNNLMKSLNLYEPPEVGVLYGNYFHHLLNPTCHIGKCHPMARDNMLPVCAEWFAALRSMMNFKILTGTNGVARYVV